MSSRPVKIPAASSGAFRAGGHCADLARSASTCPSKESICYIGGICPPNPLTRMPFLPTASSGASWHDFVMISKGKHVPIRLNQCRAVNVGQTSRRLSFFVMVLCYSRMMYVECTVSQTMEHFLACHQHAFEYFGAVPHKVMVDNLKSAVLRRALGEAPVLNPTYADYVAPSVMWR